MSGKYAILSMDIEDWYHLDYYSRKDSDSSKTMLDGFGNYLELLDKYGVKTTFFVLSELAGQLEEQLRRAHNCGHEIACHGKSHARPLTISTEVFERELFEAKSILSGITGCEVIGYRAPCYSIDNQRYEIVRKTGFKYSSSKMDVPSHPLYGTLDISGYRQIQKGIYEDNGFFEFTLSTKRFMGRHIAVSGGGWIRLFPWKTFMKLLIKSYLKNAEVYTLYIHPFELSENEMPVVEGISPLTKIRATHGLGKVGNRIEELIVMLKEGGFEIITFRDYINIFYSDSNMGEQV